MNTRRNMKAAAALVALAALLAPVDALASITSRQVVREFKAAGLEATRPKAMTPNQFGVAPVLTSDATHFLIPSMCDDGECGGRVFAFNTRDAMLQTQKAYDDLGKSTGLLFSWTFTNDDELLLLQINGELPAPRARAYRRVLRSLVT